MAVRVVVLYGGDSSEREVSLRTGRGIMNALRAKGYDVIGIDFRPTRECLAQLVQLQADVVYIALHGRYGEDGRLQGLLDLLGIPYVGSGVLASALAMDKVRSKTLARQAGIRVAPDRVIRREELDRVTPEELVRELGLPLVIKPNREGSTVGLTVALREEEVRPGLEQAARYDDTILVESFVPGVEVTVGVLGDETPVALPVIEIVPRKNFYYDYASKYAPGGSEHIIPARIAQEAERKVREWAVAAYRLLGCQNYARVDFIVPKDGSDPVLLEVNTLPGMTETSLFPDAARAYGLSYPDMVDRLIQLALRKPQG
ncbi:MAG TPA: D-alanine--D-alanine ligase [Calditerricola sp.]